MCPFLLGIGQTENCYCLFTVVSLVDVEMLFQGSFHFSFLILLFFLLKSDCPNIGLAKKFFWVFPQDVLGKPMRQMKFLANPILLKLKKIKQVVQSLTLSYYNLFFYLSSHNYWSHFCSIYYL